MELVKPHDRGIRVSRDAARGKTSKLRNPVAGHAYRQPGYVISKRGYYNNLITLGNLQAIGK